jgi:two-component system, NtrC family, sensor histidine kinase HydH
MGTKVGGNMTTLNNKIYISVILTLPFVITWLHYWLFEGHDPAIVLEEIYYIPLFLGILRFGIKGAVWAYVVVSLAYLPFLFGIWVTTSLAVLDRFLHLLFSGIFALLAGFLIDRERRHQKESEKDRYLAGLGQVATTIVHDLKNPLITILAFARRIREGKGDIDKAVHAIWDSAQNMQKIVESTLDFARPIQLDIKEEELTGILNNVFDSCKPKAEESGVTLTLEVPPYPLKIAVDGHNMARALTNLVSNSIEASRAGQNVIISAEKGEKNFVIRVSDKGMGMDKEVLENIFVPFYTKKSKGTGLGMPIVKKIVEGHSGKIIIDSRIGHGTEVIVELPDRPLFKG